jgi:hypothetical protein
MKLLYHPIYERHAFFETSKSKVEEIFTMFFGRACIIGARDIFEWILTLGTYIWTLKLAFSMCMR